MASATTCNTCGKALDDTFYGGVCSACLFNSLLAASDEAEADNSEAPNQLLANPSDARSAAASSALPPSTEAGNHGARFDLSNFQGQRIGPYRLLEKLGEGAVGVVFEAEQEKPISRRVALKLLKPGMDTSAAIARFEAERQALALMEHPAIAKVFDAGMAPDGRLYFAMELVRGLRITEYCDAHRLSIRERLELFIRVCQGVQHAHQKGIIHRDLKPSNILVTVNDGVPIPKIIDFGIYKAVEGPLAERTALTLMEQAIGTPAYMSPEQAGSDDIDTRSDIYALGAILYELLTGETPFDIPQLLRGGIKAALTAIREQEAALPSGRLRAIPAKSIAETAHLRSSSPPKLLQSVRGDLDWIAHKALEKDRQRRYATANGLAADIERHLQQEPVLARPPSTADRLGKFVRRHRLAVASSLIVVLALLTGLTLSIAGYRRAERSRQAAVAALAEAERQRASAVKSRDEAEAVTAFFTKLIFAADPAIGGMDASVRSVVDHAAATVGDEFKDRPGVELTIRWTMAETYGAMGRYDLAEAQAARAVALARTVYGPDALETLGTERSYASILEYLNRDSEAEQIMRRILSVVSHRSDYQPDEIASFYVEFANQLQKEGHHDEALENYQQALALYRAKPPANHYEITLAKIYEVKSLQLIGRCTEALEVCREVSDTLKAHPEDGSNDIQIKSSAAMVELGMGAYRRAEEFAREAYNAALERIGPENWITLRARLQLGNAIAHQGRFAEGAALVEPAMADLRRVMQTSPDVVTTYCGYGALAQGLAGHLAEAIQTGQTAFALYRSKQGHGEQIAADLAAVLTHAGRPTEAENICRETLRDLGSLHWRNEYVLSDLRRALASALAAQGKNDEAEKLLIENHTTLAHLTIDVADQLQLAKVALAKFYRKTSQPEKASVWIADGPRVP